MNAAALHFIEIIDNETKTLKSLSSAPIDYSAALIAIGASIYLCSKTLCKMLKRVISVDNEPMQLIKSLELVQESIKTANQKMGNKAIICQFFLNKANNNFSLAINDIIQQEAQLLGIPSTELPIDEVMSRLNSPENKAMLDRSLAELRTGKVSQHELMHE
jgi:hypothetical protein